jgi:hypothetical protein
LVVPETTIWAPTTRAFASSVVPAFSVGGDDDEAGNDDEGDAEALVGAGAPFGRKFAYVA